MTRWSAAFFYFCYIYLLHRVGEGGGGEAGIYIVAALTPAATVLTREEKKCGAACRSAAKDVRRHSCICRQRRQRTPVTTGDCRDTKSMKRSVAFEIAAEKRPGSRRGEAMIVGVCCNELLCNGSQHCNAHEIRCARGAAAELK